jgi:hypothetical protein
MRILLRSPCPAPEFVLQNGMTPSVPVRIDRVTPNPPTAPRYGTYSLHITRVLKVEHWGRKRSRPR